MRSSGAVALALALAACAGRPLPQGEYLGLVAARDPVAVVTPDGTTVAWQWTVKLDGGRRIAVVQSEPMFAIGQRVRVVTGDGSARMELP